MRPLFSIFVLVIAGSLALGTGCAEGDDLFGGVGKRGGDSTDQPKPSPSPSGTGGSVIND